MTAISWKYITGARNQKQAVIVDIKPSTGWNPSSKTRVFPDSWKRQRMMKSSQSTKHKNSLHPKNSFEKNT
jgi:hypothetical protein